MISLNPVYTFKNPCLNLNSTSAQSFKASITGSDSFEFTTPLDYRKEITCEDLGSIINFLKEEHRDDPQQYTRELMELLYKYPLNTFPNDKRIYGLLKYLNNIDNRDSTGTLELCNEFSNNIGVFNMNGSDKLLEEMESWEAAYFILKNLTEIDKTDEIIGNEVNLAIGNHLKNCMNNLDLNNDYKLDLIKRTSEGIDQYNPFEGADIANGQVREAVEHISKTYNPFYWDGRKPISETREVLNRNEGLRQNTNKLQNNWFEHLL